jgi:stearoyl-CoA desaturase (delta-9 desaturase)
LQQEYDLLIKKINDFYQVRKKLLAFKSELVLAEVEKSDLMTQYKELQRHLEDQRHRWQTMTTKLTYKSI